MKEKIKSEKKVIIIASIAVILILAISILAVYLTKNNQWQNNAKAEKGQENRQEETEEMKEEKEQNQNNSSVIQAQENEKSFVREDNEYMTVYTDSEGKQAPIPRGYVASKVTGEDKINTGLVIYEGTAEVNSSNHATALTSRNQYVWVPVENPKEMYGVDSKGKKWGKLYEFGKYNSSTSSYDAYEEPQALNWTESNGVMKITSATSRREPDVVKDYDKDSKLRTYDIGTSSMNEFKMQLEKEFNQMIASVEKYGGYYIGRYETGDLNQSIPVVQKGNSNIGNQNWYAQYQKSKKLAGANSNVYTSMIWGSQWDATLRWFLTSEDEEIVKYVTDSTGKGNYSRSKKATGSSEEYKVNNIYDMAGNGYDWTIEAYGTRGRVGRRR